MQEQCPHARATAPNKSVIPLPSPGAVAMFHNTNRNSAPFLQAARIGKDSKEHKELMTTVRALHSQYLHPFKYLEEQTPVRVDQLIAKARISLPWLDKYEDCWPARIYLKRYVDARRPHLRCTKYARWKYMRMQQNASKRAPARSPEDTSPSHVLGDHNFTMKQFLGSLTPSLEHHLDAFVALGIKDQETLHAFLSWPQVIQAQFLDEGDGVLQLTSLERKSLMVGCGLLIQRALQESHVMKPWNL